MSLNALKRAQRVLLKHSGLRWQRCVGRQVVHAKKPADFSAGFVVFPFLWRKGKRILAMSYFRMTFRHTIIGAATFHGRVRNGNGWCHRAKITRGLGCVVNAQPRTLGTVSSGVNRLNRSSQMKHCCSLATAYRKVTDTYLKTILKTIG